MLADGLKPSFRYVGRRGLQGEERRRSLEPENQDVQPWAQAGRATHSNLLCSPNHYQLVLGKVSDANPNSDVSVDPDRNSDVSVYPDPVRLK
jgi:hypothetical protein